MAYSLIGNQAVRNGEMDESFFVKNERPMEYVAIFDIRGRVEIDITAESRDDAEAKARAMAHDEEFELCPDDIEEVDVVYVRKSPTMFLVLRDGKNMQTSRPQEGDLPRQPDENGF